jgi:halimadienyl-diphosphate synthase
LDIPRSLYHDAAKIEKKLNMLGYDPHTWRYSTLALSTEGLSEYVPDYAVFVEADGSVAASPASTAAALCNGSSTSSPLLDYLYRAIEGQQDGGVPFVQPFDIYECAWTLNHFRLAEAITPDDPEVRRILDFLWQMWSPEKGVSFASSLNIQDLDDTAVTFALLRWGGYPADARVFAAYEDTYHFRCWAHELDPSLSVNMRTLTALQMDKQYIHYERWRDKIAAMLRHTDLHGYFWFDKWHISPYYLTATAVWSLQGVVDDLLPPRIQWILKTQRADGGWGYYHQSTAEETAYCLQALLYWDRNVERIDSSTIHAAAQYLIDHVEDTYFPQLWVGKCLYMPRHLVRSALLMALYSYTQYAENGYNM